MCTEVNGSYKFIMYLHIFIVADHHWTSHNGLVIFLFAEIHNDMQKNYNIFILYILSPMSHSDHSVYLIFFSKTVYR